MDKSLLSRKSMEIVKELTAILQGIICFGDEELQRLKEMVRAIEETRSNLRQLSLTYLGCLLRRRS